MRRCASVMSGMTGRWNGCSPSAGTVCRRQIAAIRKRASRWNFALPDSVEHLNGEMLKRRVRSEKNGPFPVRNGPELQSPGPFFMGRLFQHFRPGDEHGFQRNIPEGTEVAGFHFGNGVDNIAALDDFSEYGISPALRGGGAEIQKVVVLHIDEELGAGGMRIGSPGMAMV